LHQEVEGKKQMNKITLILRFEVALLSGLFVFYFYFYLFIFYFRIQPQLKEAEQ
jgi:hypothetical protein